MGQTSLFDIMDSDSAAATLHQKPPLDEWPENEILAFEKEMLGLYVSSHPLARHADLLRRFSSVKPEDIPNLREGQEVVVGGLIAAVKHHVTARGSKMAFVTLDTLDGPCEVTVFSDIYEQRAGLLVPEFVVMTPARVTFRNNAPGLVAADVFPIEEAEGQLTRAVHIRLQTLGLEESLVEQLARVLGAWPGRCGVYLHCITPENTDVTIRATKACLVTASPALRDEVEALLGEGAIWFSGDNGYHAAE